MFTVVMAWTYARAILNALIACLATRPAAAILTTPKADLFVNDYVPQVDDTMSAYTLASFPGYAEDVLTFSSTVNTGDNTAAIVAPATWEMTATGTVTGTCYGVVMSDGAGNFQGAARFEAPVLFTLPGDALFTNVPLPALRSLPNDG